MMAADTASESRDGTIYPWFVVAVLLLAYTLSFIDRQVLGLLVEPIKRDLGLSDFAFSLSTGLPFAFFYVLMGIFAGRIADTWNRRNLILAGLLVWITATAASGFVTGVVSLVAARAILAIGESTLSPAAYSMLHDYFPENKRARAMSIYSFGVYLGSSLAFMGGGIVLAMAGENSVLELPLFGMLKPWQATFIAVALPGILIVALMFLVKEPSRISVQRHTGHHSAGPKARTYFFNRFWFYTPVISGLASIAVVTYSFAIWLPASFSRTWGMTAGEFGPAYGAIILVFGGSGMLIAGHVVDSITSKGRGLSAVRTSMYALVGLSVSTFFFAFAPSKEVAIASVAAATFFLGVPVALGPVIILPETPSHLHGRAVSIATFFMTIIGLGAGPSLVGLLVDAVFRDEAKLQLALGLVACAAAINGFMLLLLGSRSLTPIASSSERRDLSI